MSDVLKLIDRLSKKDLTERDFERLGEATSKEDFIFAGTRLLCRKKPNRAGMVMECSRGDRKGRHA